MPLLFPRTPGRGLPGDPGVAGGVGPAGVKGPADPRAGLVLTAAAPVAARDTWTKVAFDAVGVDDLGMADLVNSPDQVKIPVDGTWFAAADVRWPEGLDDIECRVVAPAELGDIIVLDDDHRDGAGRSTSCAQMANMFDGRLVYLEVRYTGGPDTVPLEGARLTLLGGRGIGVYWPEVTMFDPNYAWALRGSYDILTDIVGGGSTSAPPPAPSPAPTPGNTGDLAQVPSQGCGPIPAVPWPYGPNRYPPPAPPPPIGGGSGGGFGQGGGTRRNSLRLKRASADDAYHVTWANSGTNGCGYNVGGYTSQAVSARALAKVPSGVTTGMLVERSDGARLVWAWTDGTLELRMVLADGTESVVESFTPPSDGDALAYELTIDCKESHYFARFNGTDAAMEGDFPAEVRQQFTGNTRVRGGLFTQNGDTRLVPGPTPESGPVLVNLLPGEAHLDNGSSHINQNIQARWPRLAIRSPQASKTVKLKARCPDSMVGRTLRMTTQLWQGETEVLLGSSVKDVTIPAPEFSAEGGVTSVTGGSLPVGTRVSFRLDDAVKHDICDPLILTAVVYS